MWKLKLIKKRVKKNIKKNMGNLRFIIRSFLGVFLWMLRSRKLWILVSNLTNLVLKIILFKLLSKLLRILRICKQIKIKFMIKIRLNQINC